MFVVQTPRKATLAHSSLLCSCGAISSPYIEHHYQELISSDLLIMLNNCWKEPNNHEWTSASLVINIVITELLIIIRLRQSRKHQRFWASLGRYMACSTLVSWFTALSLFWTCLWLIPAPMQAQKSLLIACKKLWSFQTYIDSVLRRSLFWGLALQVLGETCTAFVCCSCHYRHTQATTAWHYGKFSQKWCKTEIILKDC